tara:strand:- start:72 stop:305 length:234 start_codon:yes stop_codon:yes gene_type:complete
MHKAGYAQYQYDHSSWLQIAFSLLKFVRFVFLFKLSKKTSDSPSMLCVINQVVFIAIPDFANKKQIRKILSFFGQKR